MTYYSFLVFEIWLGRLSGKVFIVEIFSLLGEFYGCLLITSAVWSSVLWRTDTIVPMRLLYTRASMLTFLVQTVSSWCQFG